MIMASHQTFSDQFKHLTDQTKNGQINFLHIIYETVIEFLIKNQCPNNFQIFNTYHKHCNPYYGYMYMWSISEVNAVDCPYSGFFQYGSYVSYAIMSANIIKAKCKKIQYIQHKH